MTDAMRKLEMFIHQEVPMVTAEIHGNVMAIRGIVFMKDDLYLMSHPRCR